jgi:hypothetical protein
MLTPALRAAYSPDALAQAYSEMCGAESAAPTILEVVTTLTEWPERQDGDVGWAYVAIAGHMYSEAITCIVVGSPGNYQIRSIEWGRP